MWLLIAGFFLSPRTTQQLEALEKLEEVGDLSPQPVLPHGCVKGAISALAPARGLISPRLTCCNNPWSIPNPAKPWDGLAWG